MEYGGSDVSRLFHSLLARCGVALPELNLTYPADVIQLQALKETCCHLDLVRFYVCVLNSLISSITHSFCLFCVIRL